MRRRLLIATTLCVACGFVVSSLAAEPSPKRGIGAGKAGTVPVCVLEYLSEAHSAPQVRLAPDASLTDPIQLSPLCDTSGAANIAYRQARITTVSQSSSAELPLVPLPSPLYSGMVGLLGLGMVRVYHRVRKSLR